MSVPNNFVSWLRSRVSEYKSNFSLKTDADAFAGWALSYIHEISPDDAYNQCDTLTQGDAGLDGYHLDKEAEYFYLTQAKYLTSPESLISPESLRAAFSILDMLSDPKACATRGHKIMEIGQVFRDAIASGCQPVLQFLLFGRISAETEEELKVRASGHALDPKVEVWTPQLFYKEFLSREGSRDLSGVEISLKILGNQYFHVKEPAVDGISSALVANLDAADLANQVHEHMPEIVATNVRYHLGHQNRVNRQILRTLDDQSERNAFWYYNNGITIVCDKFDVSNNANGSTTIVVTNPQIVNGCQTVTALVARRTGLHGTPLPLAARIISRTEGETGTHRLLKIAEHTNSQSPVKPEDLKSNDRVQVQLQSFFANLPEPWFYERKRREWHSLSRSEKKKYKPDHRVTKEDIGQRWRAFDGHPAEAVSEKEEMFSAPLYGEVYREDRDVRLYLLAHLIFEDYWRLLDKSHEEIRGKLLPSFNERLLNRVLRGKKLWVMHCLHLTRVLLEHHYGELDGNKAEQINRILQHDPRSFDEARKRVLMAFKQWADALGDEEDMRAALKGNGVAAKWRDNLMDLLALVGDVPLPNID